MKRRVTLKKRMRILSSYPHSYFIDIIKYVPEHEVDKYNHAELFRVVVVGH